jgi:hypothetical protein
MKEELPINEPAWRKAIEQICAELGWKARVQSTEERILIICPLPEDKYFSGVLFVISGVAKRLVVYVAYRKKASSKHWNAMSEAVTRINAGLLSGCLELDPEQGEVRYRDGLLLAVPDVNIELLRTLVATTLRDALGYHSIVEAVAAGQPPAQAIANIETM